MTHTKKYLIILLSNFLLISWLFVFGICNYANASEFGPFQGKILDVETKEPVKGVVVLIEWRQYRLSSLFENTIFYDAQETLTDKNGKFYMSGIRILNPWTRLMLEPHLTIYKSGYYGIQVPWGALLTPWGEQVEGTRKSYVLEVKDEKPVIMLKKLETIEERRRSIPGEPHVSLEKYDLLKEKWKLLKQEIYKEEKLLGIK